MDKNDNPFALTAYYGEDYYCGRTEETSKVLEVLKSGKNAAVISLRRMGKTSFVQHVFENLKNKKGNKCFYVNVYPTDTIEDFIKAFAAQTLGKLDNNHIKLMRELANYFTHLRPFINYDKSSGASNIEFTLDAQYKAEHTLEQIFTYLSKQSGQIFVVFDEIQQVFEFPGTSIEQLLKSNISNSKNIRFLFTLNRNLKSKTLLKSEKSLLKDLDIINLDKIEHEIYSDFIVKKFAESKRKISDNIADQILEWARNHTYYVQLVCNRLFTKGIRQPDEWYVDRLIAEMIEEKSAVYFTYRTLLTRNQWLLLKAIALSKGARQILSGDFIKRNDLGSTSSVQTAMGALIEKEMIHQEEGAYYVTDVLLSRWLEYH